MSFFITGTDTEIGKTLVSSWLCLHSEFDYFKPIQSGACEQTDSQLVRNLSKTRIFQENYCLQEPVSPHIAAMKENVTIDLSKITLPKTQQIIVEGAGGVMVPINDESLMIDIIKKFELDVIIVCSAKLGTINHTILTIEALRSRNINIAGIIVSGEYVEETIKSIETYGKIEILGNLPYLSQINYDNLKKTTLSKKLTNLFRSKK